MADKGILFSAPMVRALLREIEAPGTGKTQTRRALNPQPAEWQALVIDITNPMQDEDGQWGQVETIWSGPLVPGMCEPEREEWRPLKGLRYAVGDRLYVREAWHAARSLDQTPPRDIPMDASIEHAATARGYAEIGLKGRLRPGMHMPRWASRITLTVTEVRVQPLQEISRADAIAEGLVNIPAAPPLAVEMGCDWGFEGDARYGSPVSAYAALWEHINGPEAWAANPWIAAYIFTVQAGNIDMIGGRNG